MDERDGRIAGTTLLLVWGLLVVVIGLPVYNPLNRRGMAGGFRWLAVVISLIVAFGLVGSSILTWRRGRSSTPRARLLSGVIGVVGAVIVVGTVPVVRPWKYTGLAGGLRTVVLAGLATGGGLLVIAGVRWYRAKDSRSPVSILAFLTGVGLFYAFDTHGLLLGLHPVIYTVIFLAFTIGPLFGIHREWNRLFDSASSSVGNEP